MTATLREQIQRFKAARGVTYLQLAQILGISHDYARKIGCGDVETISAPLARRIEASTRGELRAQDLVFPELSADAKRHSASKRRRAGKR